MRLRTLLSPFRRLLVPFQNEIKRQLCFRGISAQVFRVSELGDYRFLCGSATEYYRTVGYGGELKALGAFLFLLRRDDVVWDVGASVGLFTVHAAGMGAHVVALEPDPATLGRLKENVRLNALEQRVTVLGVALSEVPGQMALHSDGLVGGAPSLADLGRHLHQVRVPVDTVDALVARGGAPRPTVLKIDVEGAEGAVIAGARATLCGEVPPRLLLLELHPKFLPSYGWSESQVTREVARVGYLPIATQRREDQWHMLAVRHVDGSRGADV